MLLYAVDDMFDVCFNDDVLVARAACRVPLRVPAYVYVAAARASRSRCARAFITRDCLLVAYHDA